MFSRNPQIQGNNNLSSASESLLQELTSHIFACKFKYSVIGSWLVIQSSPPKKPPLKQRMKTWKQELRQKKWKRLSKLRSDAYFSCLFFFFSASFSLIFLLFLVNQKALLFPKNISSFFGPLLQENVQNCSNQNKLSSWLNGTQNPRTFRSFLFDHFIPLLLDFSKKNGSFAERNTLFTRL